MFEKRVSSFVEKGQKLIEQKKTPEAMKEVSRGLQHYSDRILKALSPYAAKDAGLVVIALRHIADEVERNNPGTKEFVVQMSKCIVKPTLEEISKVKEANRK